MKTIRYLGLLCVSLAMFALAAGGTTPANAGALCDPLADATPGLQGLCVAMCEAQGCEAEYDTNTGEVVFNPSCSPSSDELLENYIAIAGPDDPIMPCVQVACPCWTETELDDIAERSRAFCMVGKDFSGLFGASADSRGDEHAIVSDDDKDGRVCSSKEQTPYDSRWRSLDDGAYDYCQATVRAEIDSRKMACYQLD